MKQQMPASIVIEQNETKSRMDSLVTPIKLYARGCVHALLIELKSQTHGQQSALTWFFRLV